MRRLWVFIALCCVLGAVFPTVAQLLTQDVPLNGARISIPADWTLEADAEFGGQVAIGDAVSIGIYDPVVVGELMEVARNASPRDVVADFAEIIGIRPPWQVESYADTSRASAMMRYDNESSGGALIATRIRNGRFLVLNVRSDGQVVDKSLAFANQMIDSYMPDPTLSPGMVSEAVTTEAEAVPVVNIEPCFVAQADGATLRVGPGLNRSSIAFLNTTTPVTVTGRFVADNGGIWYQLDRTQAAPQSAANELWVAAEQVETTGGCDTIGEVAAPPIIRASNPPAAPAAPPPAASAPEANTTTPTTGEAAPPAPPEQPANTSDQPPASFIIPQAGVWTLTLNANSDVSCEGSENVVIASSELWEELSWTGTLSAQRDGTSLNIDGDLYVFQPPNYYVGSLSTDWGGNVQIWYSIQSPTLITGWATINETYDDGLSCSGTTGVTLTRN
jgi:hypothetical protein